MKHVDTFTVKQLLHELNEYRKALGEAPVKEWKASRAKLIAALEAANERAMKTMDPLDIPTFLQRRDPRCYIHQAVTPEIQSRIDAAMAKTKAAIVGSSFAQFDAPAAKAPRVKKEHVAKTPRVAPPADTFHLTSLGEGRVLRALARKHTEFFKPLEVGKYLYRDAHRERIVAFIQEKTS
jgi:hypothetical protein